ncbi:MAG: L-threonylcarbamoyladenylate synthase [Gammaproteobacteria bacterium]
MNMTTSVKIRRAAAAIRAGGVVAYPTEAVYGLGCDPDDADAVQRILALKRRPESAGVILIAADVAQLSGWIAPTRAEAERLAAGDEGVTWVVTAGAGAPTWITGGRDTIAVRITQHPVAAALCRSAGMPIVSTSANRSGKPPARDALSVRLALGAEVDCVLSAPTGGKQQPSEIRDARTGAILRAG